MALFRHILVPVDFGDATQPAIDLAISLAQASDAQLTLVHAFDSAPFMSMSPFVPPLDLEPVLASLERDMKTLREATQTRWPRVTSVVCRGNVYESILEIARTRGCDLIVMGTHGRRGVAHALLGSVAEKVVRLSTIPVLTVRPAASAAKSAATAA